MKFKALLLIVGFAPAMVMAQAKPATPSSIEKPIAVNPPEQVDPAAVQVKVQEAKAAAQVIIPLLYRIQQPTEK